MTHFDRVIPPGGKGNITVAVDTTRVIGRFRKKVFIFSNAPGSIRTVLTLTGEVRYHITLKPGAYISLWGEKGRPVREHLDIINNHEQPVHILGIESDLGDRIRWRLSEIRSGYVYRLEVTDVSKRPGDYTGHMVVRTDNALKPELVIIINGAISPGEGSDSKKHKETDEGAE